jgi:hypothetical protein
MRKFLTQLSLRRLVGLSFALLLTIGLTACGNNGPTQAALKSAITQQIIATQTPLSQQLKLPAPTPQDIAISHIQITDQSSLQINNNPGYHLQGTYDLSLKQSDHRASQTGDRFDLYLLPKQVGKIIQWQTAQPNGNGWKLAKLP